MAKYKNSNVQKAEYDGAPFDIVMDKLGNNLLLNETQFKRIKK